MEKEDQFENGIPTSSLLNRLFKSSDLNDFLKKNEKEMVIPTFMEHLDRLCRERNTIREHVIKRSGIERCFGNQLFRGTRKPSRDNVLRLAFGLGLSVEAPPLFGRYATRKEYKSVGGLPPRTFIHILLLAR